MLFTFCLSLFSNCTNIVTLKKTKCENGYYRESIKIDESKNDDKLFCESTVKHLNSILHKQAKVKLLFQGNNFKIFSISCRDCNHSNNSFILYEYEGKLKLIKKNRDINLNLSEIEKMFVSTGYTASDKEEIKRVIKRIIQLNTVSATNW